MAYNFFESRPVRNARAYYLRTILHGWSDQFAMKILENVRVAMPPDARLLINEHVIADEGALLFAVWMDTVMMTMFSAWERNRAQWLKLFDDAGFELIHL